MNRPSVLLSNPKYDHNVGAAYRAAAINGAESLMWTGRRVVEDPRGRLPREERLAVYRMTCVLARSDQPTPHAIRAYAKQGWRPVAVERRPGATSLEQFAHPDKALYVFGPEDDSLGRATLEECHDFIVIPSVLNVPLNLAGAVYVTLYSRLAQRLVAG